MPKKVPLVSIVVSRDGKNVYPPVGEAFEFTREEVRDLSKLSTETGTDYLRDPVNEDPQPGAKTDPKAAEKKDAGPGL